jgi:hypothetical protein
MNLRRLTLFSIFLSLYSVANTVFSVDIIGVNDQLLGILCAIFIPYIGYKYYGYFLAYRGFIFLTLLPNMIIVAQGLSSNTPLNEKTSRLIIWLTQNPHVSAALMLTIVFIESYIYLPHLAYLALKKAGFYEKVNRVLAIS